MASREKNNQVKLIKSRALQKYHKYSSIETERALLYLTFSIQPKKAGTLSALIGTLNSKKCLRYRYGVNMIQQVSILLD